MKQIINTLILGLLFCLPFQALAQESEAAVIEVSLENQNSLKVGETSKLLVTVTPKKGWHVYSAIPSEEMAYNPTSIYYEMTSAGFEAGEELSEKGEMHSEYDDVMQGVLRSYKGQVIFSQPLKITEPGIVIDGTLDYMGCNDFKCVMYSAPLKLNYSAK